MSGSCALAEQRAGQVMRRITLAKVSFLNARVRRSAIFRRRIGRRSRFGGACICFDLQTACRHTRLR
jgi:hypothetical protein